MAAPAATAAEAPRRTWENEPADGASQPVQKTKEEHNAFTSWVAAVLQTRESAQNAPMTVATEVTPA